MTTPEQTRIADTLAREYPEVIKATERGGYLISSLSQPGAFWLVRPEGGRLHCPCPYGREIETSDNPKKRCRHMRLLIRYAAAESELRKRPTPPTNASALVD